LKALKYYFLEFRNKGIFYEAVINQMLDDLVQACQPRYMEVIGEFTTRGGMHSVVKGLYDPEKRGAFR
jgi:7-cyano-7-deazaguanine reductase